MQIFTSSLGVSRLPGRVFTKQDMSGCQGNKIIRLPRVIGSCY